MTTNELLDSVEIAVAEDATTANYPILQVAYDDARNHMLELFPEFAHVLTTGFRLVPIRTPEYGRYIAKINVTKKVIFIGAWMNGCPVKWDGKELVLRENGTTRTKDPWHDLIGIVRHELAHAIQYANKAATGIDDGHGSTHLCKSWWWVMSEWAKRLYGPDTFLSVDDFERISKLVYSKKNGKHIYDKDERKSFAYLCSGFEYNYSRQSLLDDRAEWLDEKNFSLKGHGNKGLKRDRVEKTCTHCGISFMASKLQVRCSIACNVKAGRLKKKITKDLARKERLAIKKKQLNIK